MRVLCHHPIRSQRSAPPIRLSETTLHVRWNGPLCKIQPHCYCVVPGVYLDVSGIRGGRREGGYNRSPSKRTAAFFKAIHLYNRLKSAFMSLPYIVKLISETSGRSALLGGHFKLIMG